MNKDRVKFPWVVVSPDGLVYLGLHYDEADAWQIALGWPSKEEINERKRLGWYAAQATLSWKKDKAISSSVNRASGNVG